MLTWDISLGTDQSLPSTLIYFWSNVFIFINKWRELFFNNADFWMYCDQILSEWLLPNLLSKCAFIAGATIAYDEPKMRSMQMQWRALIAIFSVPCSAAWVLLWLMKSPSFGTWSQWNHACHTDYKPFEFHPSHNYSFKANQSYQLRKIGWEEYEDQDNHKYFSTLLHFMPMMLQMLWTTTALPLCLKVLSLHHHYK